MRKIKIEYTTSDGKIFDDNYEAEGHQVYLDDELYEKIKSDLKNYIECSGIVSDSDSINVMLGFILETYHSDLNDVDVSVF